MIALPSLCFQLIRRLPPRNARGRRRASSLDGAQRNPGTNCAANESPRISYHCVWASRPQSACHIHQRIHQLDSGESPEIVVRGSDFAAVFDCERRQMSIRSEVARSAAPDQEIFQYGPMCLAWADEGNVRLCQPFVDKTNGMLDRKRCTQDAGARGNPDEGQNYDPWDSDSGITGQCTFEPPACSSVMRGIGIDGIDQEVGVEQYHLRKSSSRAISSSSSAAASLNALSILIPGRTPPSEAGLRRYGRGLGASLAVRPLWRVS